MATATGNILEISVDFGGVSFGKETARLGVAFSRERCSLESADSVLNGKRLDGRVVCHHPDRAWNQKPLPGAEDGDRHEIVGSFDIKGLKVSRKRVGCGLAFSINDIDREALTHFGNRTGTLLVRTTADLPEKAGNGSNDGDDSDDEVIEVGDRREVPKRVRLVRNIKGHASPLHGLVVDSEHEVDGSNGRVTIFSKAGKPIELSADDYVAIG